jgi:hypothetical protein
MDQTPEDWLADLFEFETCAECGGDAADHDVCLVPGIGNYFARCRRSVEEPDATVLGGGPEGIEGPDPPPAIG